MLNLSQRELAEELQISKSTYARWETGEKIIPLTHLVDLCNLSNRSLDYVLGLNNDRSITNNKLKIDSQLIGNKLKKLRIKNNESQEEIADFLQCTQSVISEYENGITLIQTSFLLQLCNKYNISADTLLS
ncbi:MAG: transcriptional regulator [Bacilli bacterium]|nr:transcriptional regulator [Bacilli bacterium]